MPKFNLGSLFIVYSKKQVVLYFRLFTFPSSLFSLQSGFAAIPVLVLLLFGIAAGTILIQNGVNFLPSAQEIQRRPREETKPLKPSLGQKAPPVCSSGEAFYCSFPRGWTCVPVGGARCHPSSISESEKRLSCPSDFPNRGKDWGLQDDCFATLCDYSDFTELGSDGRCHSTTNIGGFTTNCPAPPGGIQESVCPEGQCYSIEYLNGVLLNQRCFNDFMCNIRTGNWVAKINSDGKHYHCDSLKDIAPSDDECDPSTQGSCGGGKSCERVSGVYKCVDILSKPVKAACQIGKDSGQTDAQVCNSSGYYCENGTTLVNKEKGVCTGSGDTNGCEYTFTRIDCSRTHTNGKCINGAGGAPASCVPGTNPIEASGGTLPPGPAPAPPGAGSQSSASAPQATSGKSSAQGTCGIDANGLNIPCYAIGVFSPEDLAATEADAKIALKRYDDFTKVLNDIKGKISSEIAQKAEEKAREKLAAAQAKANACVPK